MRSMQIFSPDNKVHHAVIRGNGFAKQQTAERVTTVAAPELNVSYNDAKVLSDANTIGESASEITPTQNIPDTRMSS